MRKDVKMINPHTESSIPLMPAAREDGTQQRHIISSGIEQSVGIRDHCVWGFKSLDLICQTGFQG